MEKIIGHRTAETGGCSDQPRAVLGKHLEINTWPVVVPLELGQCGKLQEIAVSGLVLREEQQVIRLALLGPGAAFGQIGLDADNRMQPGARRGACTTPSRHT